MMIKKPNRIILSLTFLLSISISFIVGINLGFSDGYSFLSNLRCSGNAFDYARSLKALRENKIGDVIELMEIKLDSSIIEHEVSTEPSFAFFFVPISHIFSFNPQKDLSLFKQAIEYRKLYPSPQENEAIRTSVHSHLKEIEEKLKD